MSSTRRAFVGLGSNLASPREQLQRALAALEKAPGVKRMRRSSLYRSAPMGPQDQPDFINAVAELETTLEAEALLDLLQSIEQAQGRVRGKRWGPRTLDLDLLLYANDIIRTERLAVPHPGLPERAFVLYPLAELAPELDVPGAGRVNDLLAAIDRDGLEKLPE